MDNKFKPCFSKGVLGMSGFESSDDIFCVEAKSTGEFLHNGITDGSIIFVNAAAPYSDYNLNVFAASDRTFVLSRGSYPEGEYKGKAVVAVTILL